MLDSLQRVLIFAAAPAGAALAGGVIAVFWPPPPKLRSAVQHLAAGVVFAAAAAELLPDIKHSAPVAVGVGFAIGSAVMLLLKQLTQGSAEGDGPWGFIGATAVDVAIDGLLLGIGFTAGQRQGVLLAIALTMELLFLGVSTTTVLSKRYPSRGPTLAATAGGAILFVGASALGAGLLTRLSGNGLAAVIAFGLAALLYLVTEELLVEAHEVPGNPVITGMFFLGFLALLMIDTIL